jgi:hypothetical protein
MSRIRLSLLVIALSAAPWSNGHAAGSFQTKAAFSNEVSDSYSSISVAHALKERRALEASHLSREALKNARENPAW